MARPTLEQVAREAAVSRQTVSNVLNAPDRVRPETRDRVLDVVARLDYRPNRAARTLRTRRSRLVGLRMEPPVDGTLRAVLDRYLHSVTRYAQEHDYQVLLFPSGPDESEIETYSALLEDQDLDALILTGIRSNDPRTAWLLERRVPFVTFGRPWGHTPAHNAWVDVDGAAGTRQATGHLVRLGHRRIAFLGWPHDSATADDRRSGWRSACTAAGLDTGRLSLTMLDSLEAGRRACSELLDLADPPTALVCTSDSLAVGAWTELTSRGLRPGHDMDVIGFDDSPTAGVIGLSSVAQPVDAAAAASLRLLHDVLTHPEPGAHQPVPVLLEPRLVIRDSTGSRSAR